MSKRKLGCLVVLAVLLVLFVVLAWPWLYFGTTLPRRDFRAEFAALVSDACGVTQPQGQAAWDDYQRVLALQREAYTKVFGTLPTNAEGQVSLGETIALTGWGAESPEHDARVRSLLNAMDEAGMGEALDVLAQHRAWNRPLPQELLSLMLLPDLSQSRALYRALRLRASDPQSTPEARMTAIRRAVHLGRLCGNEPIAISWLVGIAISTGAAEEAQRLAAGGALSSAQCRELAGLFQSPTILPTDDVIEGELLFGLDSIQTALRDVPIRPFNRSATTARFTDLMRRYESWSSTPLATRSRQSPVSDDEITSRKYPTIGLLMPAAPSMIVAGDGWDVTRRGTNISLHVETYAKEHGKLPESLDALGLEPRFLNDPCTDKPFIYRPLPAPDASGRRYLLYSVGIDGNDNGGVQDPKKPTNALRTVSTFDFIVGGPTPETVTPAPR